MRAAVVSVGGGGFHVEDLVIDEPRGREVLVDVKASGLCHSDLHVAGADFGHPMPAVMGHEIAGVVAAIGPEVREFRVGDHVVASLVRMCGHCVECLSGHSYQCVNRDENLRAPGEPPRLRRPDGTPVVQSMGTGGFAEQTLVHENQLVAIDPAVPFAAASLLGCGVIAGAGAAINTANVAPGESVAVIGAGGVGLNVISGARLSGADPIIAIDMGEEKLGLAKRFGATHVIDAGDTDDVVAAVREITGGGVHYAFEVVGMETTCLQAVRMLKMGGMALLVGVHKPGATLTLDLPSDLLFSQRVVRGVYMGSTNIKVDIPAYARLYLDGRLELDALIAEEIALSEVDAAFGRLVSGRVGRAVITSWD